MVEEGGALQFSDATFAQILLDAHKLHVAIKVTEELLYDSAFNLESYIIEQFGKAPGPMPRRMPSSTVLVMVSPLAFSLRLVAVPLLRP